MKNKIYSLVKGETKNYCWYYTRVNGSLEELYNSLVNSNVYSGYIEEFNKGVYISNSEISKSMDVYKNPSSRYDNNEFNFKDIKENMFKCFERAIFKHQFTYNNKSNSLYIYVVVKDSKSVKLITGFMNTKYIVKYDQDLGLVNNDIDFNELFVDSFFEKYNENTEINQSLFKLNYTDSDIDIKHKMNITTVIDLETYEDANGKQQIGYIGLIRLSVDDLEYLKSLEIDNKELFKIYKETLPIYYEGNKLVINKSDKFKEFIKSNKDSPEYNHHHKIKSIIRKCLIYDLFNKTKEEYIEILTRFVKDIHYDSPNDSINVYTYNGKNFDYHILIKELIKCDLSNLEVLDVVKCNNMYYRFTIKYDRKDLMDIREIVNKGGSIDDGIMRVYGRMDISDIKKDFIKKIIKSKSVRLSKNINFFDITTITPPTSLLSCFNKLFNNSKLGKENYDVVQYMRDRVNNKNTKEDDFKCRLYLTMDCITTIMIVYSISKTFIQKLKIDPTKYFTIGQISLQVLKRFIRLNSDKEKDENIYVVKDSYLNAIIRQSLYGGRVYVTTPIFNNTNKPTTEHFGIDDEELKKYNIEEIKPILNKINSIKSKEKMHHLDVNGLYTCAMRDNEYPYGKAEIIKITIDNYKEFMKYTFVCVAKLKVSKDVVLTMLPKKSIKGKIYLNSNGSIKYLEGVYTSIDIQNFIDLDYEIEYLRGGIVWKKKKQIFEEFINFVNRERHKGDDNVYKFIMKLIGNSSYGKFSQKPFNISHNIMKKESIDGIKELNNNNRTIILRFGESEEIVNVLKIKPNLEFKYPLIISCTILSYSRSIMNKYIKSINGFNSYNLIYSDTDSLFVTCKMLEILKSKGYTGDKGDLGKLKYEEEIKLIFIFGNKMKIYLDSEDRLHITLKGFKFNSNNIKDYRNFIYMLVSYIINNQHTHLDNIDNDDKTHTKEDTITNLKDLTSFKVQLFKKVEGEGIFIQCINKSQMKFGPTCSEIDLESNRYC